MFPTSITKTLTGANAANIAASQSLGAAGDLTLTSATVTLDTQRRVIITSAANDSGMTWTVTGTDETNNIVVDTFAGGNIAAVQSSRDFKTVTQITGSAATAGAVTAGTNGVGSSSWHSLSTMQTPVNASVAVHVTGTINYTVEYTYDAYWNLPSGVTLPIIYPVQTLSGLTVDGEGTLAWPVTGVRLTINSSSEGTARLVILEAGVAGP